MNYKHQRTFFSKIFTLLLLPFFLFLLPVSTSAQFVRLDSIAHICNGVPTGYIGYSLAGNESDYTFYWSDGETTLIRENLPAGIYTLYIRNLYGCEQEVSVEILDIFACKFEYTIIYDNKTCIATIILHPTANGIVIPEEALRIVWADGDNSGLIRQVSYGTQCFSVLVDVADKCCVLKATICIDRLCSEIICYDSRNSKTKLIVNETRRYEGEGGQFIELLALGSGVCGDSTDLSGFIIDDNNGYLVKGASSISQINMSNLGIDEGYIVFNNNLSWKAVPNGSLIVLYGNRSELELDFPADDPDDANSDGVYVLSVENTDYFMARIANGQSGQEELPYNGSLTYPSWSQINIDAAADGIQLRFPDGEFAHGISAGKTEYTDNNNFEMWLGATLMANRNYQFMGKDFKDKNQYQSFLSTDDLSTPGSANSDKNGELIDCLKGCDTTKIGNKNLGLSTNRKGRNSLEVFPNPFNKNLSLRINSHQDDNSQIRIYDLSGKLVWQQEKPISKGTQDLFIETQGKVPAGMLLIEVEFSDGERLHARIVSMR